MFWFIIGTALSIGAIVHGYRLYRYIQQRRALKRILDMYRATEPSETND